MILTDTDILKYIEAGKIEIKPFNKERLGSNSYDLTLGDKLLTYTGEHLDARIDNPYRIFDIPKKGYTLKPGELYLGFTREYTRSTGLCPQLEGKSSVGRLGICVHLTAGFGDIGFAGHWTLEITVVKPIKIYAGMPIAQIFWLMIMGVCRTPYSLKKNAKYSEQGPLPVPSAMWKNFEDSAVPLVGM